MAWSATKETQFLNVNGPYTGDKTRDDYLNYLLIRRQVFLQCIDERETVEKCSTNRNLTIFRSANVLLPKNMMQQCVENCSELNEDVT